MRSSGRILLVGGILCGLAVLAVGVPFVIDWLDPDSEQYRYDYEFLRLQLLEQDPSVPPSQQKTKYLDATGVKDAAWPLDKVIRFREAMRVLKKHAVTDRPYLYEVRIGLLPPERADVSYGVPAAMLLLWLEKGGRAAFTKIVILDKRGREVGSVTRPNLRPVSSEISAETSTFIRSYNTGDRFDEAGGLNTLVFCDGPRPGNAEAWDEWENQGLSVRNQRSAVPQFVIPVLPTPGAHARVSIIDDEGRESNQVEVPIGYFLYVTWGGEPRGTLYQQPGWDTYSDYLPTADYVGRSRAGAIDRSEGP